MAMSALVGIRQCHALSRAEMARKMNEAREAVNTHRLQAFLERFSCNCDTVCRQCSRVTVRQRVAVARAGWASLSALLQWFCRACSALLWEELRYEHDRRANLVFGMTFAWEKFECLREVGGTERMLKRKADVSDSALDRISNYRREAALN